MLKALFKKELLAAMAFFLQGKDGKRRSKGAAVGFAVLMVYAFGAVGAMFWMMSEALCAPLVAGGLDWVYFAFMGTLATCFGIIGGIFTAKAKLYEAKDNDLLLSMPIPAWAILLVRTVSLYLFIFLFESLVFVPSLIQYYICAGARVGSVCLGVLITLILPLGGLAICCLLGFVLAWLTARIPFKNMFTVLLSVAFMVVYFLLYSKINEYLGYVLANGEAVGTTMQTALFPLAQLGKGATGDVGAFCLFALIFIGLFALTWCLLSKTYFKIATTKRGERYAKYKEKEAKVKTPRAALLKREFLRLIKTPAYLLNASMGTLIMLLVGIMAAVQKDFFGIPQEVLSSMGDSLILLLCAVVCFMASSNFIAACAVSLEGDSLWIVRTMPVESKAVLRAKAELHFLMTALPAAIFGCAMGFVMKVSWDGYLAAVLTAVVASAAFAVMDLAINLKFPNLHWTNEMVAVKQGISSLVAMFGGWGAALAFVGLYFLFGKYWQAWGYLAFCLALLLVVASLLWAWIKKRGTKIFESL